MSGTQTPFLIVQTKRDTVQADDYRNIVLIKANRKYGDT